MFKTNFERICAQKGVAPSRVLRDIGLSNSIYSTWGENSKPRNSTLIKIAEYLGVTVADLLNGEKTPAAPSSCAPALTTGELAIIDEYRKNPAFAAVVNAAYAAVKPLKKTADAVS